MKKLMENKKNMIIALVVVVLLVVIIVNLFSGTDALSNDYIQVDGVYVNESYESEDDLKQVVVFLTVNAKENIELSSKTFSLMVNDTNEYDAYIETDTPNKTGYYHAEFIEDIAAEKEFKIALVFDVTEKDLEEGNVITLDDFDDYGKGIEIKSEDIKKLDSLEDISKDIDEEEYNTLMEAEENALNALDSDKENEYVDMVDNTRYTYNTFLGTTAITYHIDFTSKTEFEVTSVLSGTSISNDGTYEITEGYVVLTYYTSPDKPLLAKYEVTDDGLEITNPFDSNGSDEIF